MLNYLEVVYKWSFGSSAVAAAVLGQQWEGCAGTQLLLSTALPPCALGQHLHLGWDCHRHTLYQMEEST